MDTLESAVRAAVATLDSLPGYVAELFMACGLGRADEALALLAQGADPNVMTGSFSMLHMAAYSGDATIASALLDAGAAVDATADSPARTPLSLACICGHAEVVRVLLRAGADFSARAYFCNGSPSPLQLACMRAHHGVAAALLDAGADVDEWEAHSPLCPPLGIACSKGSLPLVQLLCAHGAARAHHYVRAATEARVVDCSPIADWLTATRQWCSPLHHFAHMDAARVRALLRAGADPHAQSERGAPTPLSLARLHLNGAAPDASPAGLIAAAAAPWSFSTNALFPPYVRARAWELLRAGRLIASRFDNEQVSFSDAWVAHVMPHALTRATAPP